MRRSTLEKFPATTLLVLVACAAWMVAELFGAQDMLALSAGFIPATVLYPIDPPSGVFLLPFPITPLTATLVHGGAIHLGLNMLMLVVCGHLLERTIGSWSVVTLYAVGAYCAAAGQWVLGTASVVPQIGANGAVSALIGGYALLFANQPVPRIGPFSPRVVRIAWLLFSWTIVQLLAGFANGQAAAWRSLGAPVGGFIAGLALARPLLLWRYRDA